MPRKNWRRTENTSSALTSRLYDRLLEAHPSLRLFGHPDDQACRKPQYRISWPACRISSSATYRMNSPSPAVQPARRPPLNRPGFWCALGLDPDTAATGIRISLGRFTTERRCRGGDCCTVQDSFPREPDLIAMSNQISPDLLFGPGPSDGFTPSRDFGLRRPEASSGRTGAHPERA